MLYILISHVFIFLASYECVGKDVTTFSLSERNGSLVSPGYPGNYPNNVNYTWILNTGHGNATVNFTFDVFDIVEYHGYSCTDDFLKIAEIEPCCFTVMNRCGNFSPFSLTAKGRLIRITFVSDELHSARGFSLKWTVDLPTLIMNEATTKTTDLQRTKKKRTKPAKSSISKIMKTTATKTTRSRRTVATTTHQTSPWLVAISDTTQATIKTSPTKPIRTSRMTKWTNSKPASTTSVVNSKKQEDTYQSTEVISQSLTNVNVSGVTTGKMAKLDESPLSTFQIVLLVVGIGVLEITAIAVGICVVIQRRTSSADASDALRHKKEKTKHLSRKTVCSVEHVYQSIPMEHFFGEDSIQEQESTYMDVPENVYDKAFVKRPHVNMKNNVYQWY